MTTSAMEMFQTKRLRKRKLTRHIKTIQACDDDEATLAARAFKHMSYIMIVTGPSGHTLEGGCWELHLSLSLQLVAEQQRRHQAPAAASKSFTFLQHPPPPLLFGIFLIQTRGSQTESSKWCLELESSPPHPTLSSPLLLLGGSRQPVAASISDPVALTHWSVIHIPFSLSSMQMNPGCGVTAF